MIQLLLSLLLILPAAHLSAQDSHIFYTMSEGTTLKYRLTEKLNALAQSNDGRSTKIDRESSKYFTLDIEQSTPEQLTYVFLQDTAIVVEDNSDMAPAAGEFDISNLLTARPIRVSMTPSGKLISITPMVPIDAAKKLGPQASDQVAARRAMIFPGIPQRKLYAGVSWREQHRDTLHPSKNLPGLGSGNGVRYVSVLTDYTVGEETMIQQQKCLKLEWNSIITLEEQIIFDKLEEFIEDHTVISGVLYFSKEIGTVLKVTIVNEKETTRALFGSPSSVVPSSVKSETTLELLPS